MARSHPTTPTPVKPKNLGMGPRMIGKAKFELVKAVATDKTARMGLGPRMQSPKTKTKIAKAQAAVDAATKDLLAEQAEVEEVSETTDATQANLSTEEPTEEPTEEGAEEADEVKGYSTKQVEALLAEAPGRVLDLFDAELARPDGPRKSVLKLLRRTEAAKPEADQTLLDALDAKLA